MDHSVLSKEYESAEGRQVKMTTGDVQVLIKLNARKKENKVLDIDLKL